MSNYENAKQLFGYILPGDRVRVVEEFIVEESKDGILYYRADEAVKDVDNAERWEYWPTEHTKQVIILANDERVINGPVDAAWAEFYNNDTGTPNRIKSKSSFEAGWIAGNLNAKPFGKEIS